MQQVVLFTIGAEEFGIPITDVHEIIKDSGVIAIPRAPQYMEGVINLRGHVIAVLNLSERLGLECNKGNSRILVVELHESLLGLRIDTAIGVMDLQADQISAPPQELATRVHETFITGVANINSRLIILLDLAKIIKPEEIVVPKGV